MNLSKPIEEFKEHGRGVAIVASLLITGQIIGLGIGYCIGWAL